MLEHNVILRRGANGTYIFPTVSESKMCLEELDIQHPIPYPYSNDQIAYLRSYPNRLHPYLYMIKKYALTKYLPKILEIILGRKLVTLCMNYHVRAYI